MVDISFKKGESYMKIAKYLIFVILVVTLGKKVQFAMVFNPHTTQFQPSAGLPSQKQPITIRELSNQDLGSSRYESKSLPSNPRQFNVEIADEDQSQIIGMYDANNKTA